MTLHPRFPEIELHEHPATGDEPQAYVALLRDTFRQSLLALGHRLRDDLDSPDSLVFTDPATETLLALQFHPDSEANYVRLLLPAFWPIEDEAEGLRARLALAEVAGSCKLAHLFIGGTAKRPSVSAEIELLLPLVRQGAAVDWPGTADQLALQCAPTLLRRYIGALHHVAQRFGVEMKHSLPQ